MEKPSNGEVVTGSGTHVDTTKVKEVMRHLVHETTNYKTMECQLNLKVSLIYCLSVMM